MSRTSSEGAGAHLASHHHCTYGGWRNTYDDYRELVAWDNYHECQEPHSPGIAAGDATIRLVVSTYQCYAQYFWAGATAPKDVPVIPRQMKSVKVTLNHAWLDPNYGEPQKRYPVRRIRPTLIPNP